MPTAEQIQQAIQQVTDQQSFIHVLLRDTLRWEIPEQVGEVEDIAYAWPVEELRAEGLDERIVDGQIWQVQPFNEQVGQQWGIFVLEFKSDQAFVTGRGLTGPLRKVLRGLVPNRRNRQANLPAWDRDNLLFICTHNYQQFRFAYFKPAKEKGQAEPLAMFGWDSGDAALRTLCEYNLPFLVWSDDLQHAQWREAFNVEKVAKGFYSQVAKLFTDLVGGTRKQGSKTYQGKNLLILPGSQNDTMRKEFAVRLIGRLVFCWFLKKKKSNNGVPLLPQELLSTESINNKGIGGYYHSILEPLFFEVLNTPQNERKTQFKKAPWSIIPFLNGGLFTPHEDDFYKLTFNGISEHLNNFIIPDDWIRELLEVLETYNFTIEESTPLDIEVAVDPEILGRIFENLLAEINPETGKTARKATGSYYTPRPIVEYMVDESLKQYLLTKTGIEEEQLAKLLSYSEQDSGGLTESQTQAIIDALHTVRIIDPACGSGAFPMGILQKILLILQKLDPDSRKWLDKLLSSIPDPMYQKELKRKIDQPNYLHKLGLIKDCIFGVDIQPIAVEISKLRCFLSLIVDEVVGDNIKNRGIEPLPNLEFKFVCADTLVGLPKAEVGETKKSPSKYGPKEYKGQSLMLEAADEIKELKKLRDEYLRSYRKEKKNIEERFAEIQSKLRRHTLQWSNTDTQTAKLADWEPFSHKSCPWFDPEWMFGIKDGFDIVIANPPYGFRDVLTPGQKRYFRRAEKIAFSSGDSAELFSKKCFDGLVKSKGALTFIIPKKSLYGDAWEGFRKDYWEKYKLTFLLDVSKAFEHVLFEESVFSLAKTEDDSEIKLSHLAESDTVFEFAKARKDEIFMSNGTVQIYKALYHSSLFAKIQSKSSADKLVAGQLGLAIGIDFFSDDQTDYKLLKGIDIERWIVRRHRYLANKERLRWDDAKKFLQAKVIAQVLIAHIENPIPHIKITACYDNEGIIITNTLTSFVFDESINPKFWLAYLNSSFTSWYAYNFIYSRAIRTMHFYNFYIQQIPIPQRIVNNVQLQQPFINLADKIRAITVSEDYQGNKDKQAQVKELEKQIDQMVYDLYDLTSEEIAIVEG